MEPRRKSLSGHWPVLVVLLGAAVAARADPVSIEYELRSLNTPSRYEYIYTVHNETLASPLNWFLVDFDGSLYDESTLVITSTGLGSWTEQLLASVPGLPAQYDSYKAGAGLAQGESETGFTVAFTWLGSGTPGGQAFTVWDPATFDVVTTGTTTPIPEPGAGWLGLAGLVAIGAYVGRAQRAGSARSASA